MVSNKTKRNHAKRVQRQRRTKRKTRKTNAISRKNRMIGGMKRRIQYPDNTYDGATYDGAVWPKISMNIPHGKGTMTWKNGNVYNGQWNYGKMSGLGTMTWYNDVRPDTVVSYTGNWRNNKRNGFGSLHYADGKIAKGIWRDDNPTGNFEMIWPNDDPILPRTKNIPAIQLDDFDEGDDYSRADTEPAENFTDDENSN